MNLIDFLLHSTWGDGSDRRLRSPAAPLPKKSNHPRTTTYLSISNGGDGSVAASNYHKVLPLTKPEQSQSGSSVHYQCKAKSKSTTVGKSSDKTTGV